MILAQSSQNPSKTGQNMIFTKNRYFFSTFLSVCDSSCFLHFFFNKKKLHPLNLGFQIRPLKLPCFFPDPVFQNYQFDPKMGQILMYNLDTIFTKILGSWVKIWANETFSLFSLKNTEVQKPKNDHVTHPLTGLIWSTVSK